MNAPSVAAIFALGLLGFVLLPPQRAAAHCDGMDGPVVQAAREALTKANVDIVLAWVREDDEPELRRAFERTLAVRKLGDDAAELADLYFFETLVRIHRAGEGAPYTGLKPAGRDLGPAIPLADEALATGNVEPLVKLIVGETHEGVAAAFEQAVQAKHYPAADVEAGRRYVSAYVNFIHYVERAFEAASGPVAGHVADSGHAPDGHHD